MTTRSERRVSVRLVATGGQALKAELVGIGQEGARALTLIEAAGPRAAAGLNAAGVSAGEAMRQMQDLADRAARAASALRQAGAVSGSVMNTVNRSTGVSGGMARDAADVAAYGRALDDLRAKHNPLFAVVREYRSTLTEIRQAHRLGAISAEEMTAAITRERQATLASIAAIKGRTTALGGMSTATRNASHRMANLSFQLQDIGVSLAGGMNPFMVMAQQGSQISQIYGFGNGGVGALFRDLGGMARTLGQGILQVAGRFPLVTAAVALGSAAIAGMRNEINETTGAQVSFTDVARAAWQVFAENVYQIGKPVFDTIRGWWDNAVAWADWAWERIVDGVIWMGDLVINAFKVAAAGAKAVAAEGGAIRNLKSSAATATAEPMIFQGNARYPVDEIVIHCAATHPDWMRGQPLTAKRNEIDRWHREERGWRKIGYHHLIDRDGAILPGRGENEIGAGVEGHNRGVIHICLIGGAGSAATDPFERNFTAAQDRALRGLIDVIRAETAITRITGHNDHAAKACPGFVVRTWINRA